MSIKISLLFAFLLGIMVNVFAQTIPEVTIKDIQYTNPDSVGNYFVDFKPGPLADSTVTVTGVVMVPPYKNHTAADGTIIYIGSLAGFYMEDLNNPEWGGILVYISNPANYPAFQSLDSGTVVKVTGVVTYYMTSTQITTELALTGFDGSEVIDVVNRPAPVVLTLDSLKDIGTSNSKATAEKWEGVYVEMRNVTVFDRNWTTGGFRIIDDNNTVVSIYTRSNYIYSATPPNDNAELEYIRGYIEMRSEDAGGIVINPMYVDEIKVAQLPPTITDITRKPVLVAPGQTVTVSSKIIDTDGSVANAKLYWRKDSGVNNEIDMTATSDTTYEAVIPSQPDSCVVDFFITSEDDLGNIAVIPADTARGRYFYLVLDRPLTIQDVQFSPFGSGLSGFNNYEVKVSGIVTADTSYINGNETGTASSPAVYIQNGSGPWSGIRIFGTEADNTNHGDDVTVTGIVDENYGVTQIGTTGSGVVVTVNSTGNSLPEPVTLSTSEIDDLPGGSVQAEQWEGVLVKFENLTVTDENADGDPGPDTTGKRNYGDILVADASNSNVRIDLEDGGRYQEYHNYWLPYLENQPIRIYQGDTFESITGIVWYSFSHYKIIPRINEDFVGHVSSVDNNTNASPYQYKLSQNYPNPFNPGTRINYTIKEPGMVTLKVYNILGQEVATIVNEVKSAGSYHLNFDASKLSSGIYLYRLNANGFIQTKKMILIK